MRFAGYVVGGNYTVIIGHERVSRCHPCAVILETEFRVFSGYSIFKSVIAVNIGEELHLSIDIIC
jgi:hypothetical protein